MKYRFAVLLGALLCAGALTPASSQGAGVVVSIGDQPYYHHGAYYWHRGARWYWIPGHYSWRYGRRYWVHGYYAPRHSYYARRW